jgi:hypothetical protein
MPIRRGVSKSIETDVLIASRRRCCLCVFLKNRDEDRPGQIAHLNRDPSDSRFDNLVFLCFEHHEEYDRRPSQSKALLASEVRKYRDQLYARYPKFHTVAKHAAKAENADLRSLPKTSQYEELRRRFPGELDFTSTSWRFGLWLVANEPELFAYKTVNRVDGVCLIERIDLPDERIVIACIQTAGNPGNSITNSVEYLCFQVCERFDIPSERLVWLEHYDYDDEWRRVTFAQHPPNQPFGDPIWETMTPAMWQPKRKLKISFGHFESKIDKLFHWPKDAIL